MRTRCCRKVLKPVFSLGSSTTTQYCTFPFVSILYPAQLVRRMMDGCEFKIQRKTRYPQKCVLTVLRILLIKPLFQRGKILEHGAGIHLALVAQGMERIGPGPAASHFEHRLQAIARHLVTVDRA